MLTATSINHANKPPEAKSEWAVDSIAATLRLIEKHVDVICGRVAEHPAVLTVAQVAEYLKTSHKTVQRAIDQGHLKAADIGERKSGAKHRATYRIRQEWVDEYLEASVTPGAPPKPRRRSAQSSVSTEYIK